MGIEHINYKFLCDLKYTIDDFSVEGAIVPATQDLSNDERNIRYIRNELTNDIADHII